MQQPFETLIHLFSGSWSCVCRVSQKVYQLRRFKKLGQTPITAISWISGVYERESFVNIAQMNQTKINSRDKEYIMSKNYAAEAKSYILELSEETQRKAGVAITQLLRDGKDWHWICTALKKKAPSN